MYIRWEWQRQCWPRHEAEVVVEPFALHASNRGVDQGDWLSSLLSQARITEPDPPWPSPAHATSAEPGSHHRTRPPWPSPAHATPACLVPWFVPSRLHGDGN